MSLDLSLKIYMPERIALDKKVYRVVLPYDKGKTITISKGRAPSLITLDMGEIKILDEKDDVVQEFYFASGVADVKNDECIVLTESVFDKKDLSKEKVEEMYKDFPNPFYRWLVDKYK